MANQLHDPLHVSWMRMEDWKTGGLVDWKTGGLEDWRTTGFEKRVWYPHSH